MNELIKALPLLNEPITENKQLAVIPNFTLAVSTTELNYPTPDVIVCLKALENITDRSFTLNQEINKYFTNGYPKDLASIISNTQQNQSYAHLILKLNQESEFVAVPTNQLDCYKQPTAYRAPTVYDASALINIIKITDYPKSPKDFESTILTLAKQVEHKIPGHLTATIHPVVNSDVFLLQLRLSGRGGNTKTALEAWGKSSHSVMIKK